MSDNNSVTARHVFRIGDRVRMTPEGLQQGLNGADSATRFGTIRGFGRKSHFVRVQRDGRKTTQRYHLKFWELYE